VAFHQFLLGAQKSWLVDALSAALARVDPRELKTELAALVPEDVQRILAAAAIRDEYVFPAPRLLFAQPTLIGYYRLMLGVSQKMFYRSGTGMSRLKAMETNGKVSDKQREQLPEFCVAMAASLSALVRQVSPAMTQRDVQELPLLTLGSQLQGANNVTIGQHATVEAFLAVEEIVRQYVESRTENQLIVKNASGRTVTIRLASDPDIRIQEDFDGTLRNKVAVEIKGGTDVSNVHNRAGEAEKSHQKARNEGFRDFWTIILKMGVDVEKLKAESPTTNSWFDVAQVLGRNGEDWIEFRSRIAGEVGIPVGT